MRKIIIAPRELWDFLKKQDDAGELKTAMYLIASNDEFGVDIYVTEEDAYYIVIEADGYEVDREEIINAADAERTCSKIYEDYLTENAVGILSGLGELNDEPDEWDLRETASEKIEDRESELSDAVVAFISDVLGEETFIDECDFDEVVEDCKDHFLEYLARKHDFDIYRPMILEDEDGENFFEEYPYRCMVFEDEDNPIWMK